VRRPFAAVECRRTDVAAAAAAAADGAARRENKAAKTLAIVVGGFVVCWTPFFVLYVVEPFCAACRASDAVRSVLTWLGYANSLLNPFIYATYNRHFRHSFWRLTVGQFPSKVPRVRRAGCWPVPSVSAESGPARRRCRNSGHPVDSASKQTRALDVTYRRTDQSRWVCMYRATSDLKQTGDVRDSLEIKT